MNNTQQKNFFHQQGKTYRRIAAEDDPMFDQEDALRRAKLYELLGNMIEVDPDAARFVLDTASANEEMLAYASLAARRCGLDPDTVQAIRDKMRFYFDELTAAEAVKEWDKVRGTTYTAPDQLDD